VLRYGMSAIMATLSTDQRPDVVRAMASGHQLHLNAVEIVAPS